MMSGGANIRHFDASGSPGLTEALVGKGYAPSRVRKILGANWSVREKLRRFPDNKRRQL